MSLSIVLCSDLGIPGAGSLELKIAYALWEAKKGQLHPFPTTSVLTVFCSGLQDGQIITEYTQITVHTYEIVAAFLFK